MNKKEKKNINKYANFTHYVNKIKENKFEIQNALRNRDDQKKLSKFIIKKKNKTKTTQKQTTSSKTSKNSTKNSNQT